MILLQLLDLAGFLYITLALSLLGLIMIIWNIDAILGGYIAFISIPDGSYSQMVNPIFLLPFSMLITCLSLNFVIQAFVNAVSYYKFGDDQSNCLFAVLFPDTQITSVNVSFCRIQRFFASILLFFDILFGIGSLVGWSVSDRYFEARYILMISLAGLIMLKRLFTILDLTRLEDDFSIKLLSTSCCLFPLLISLIIILQNAQSPNRPETNVLGSISFVLSLIVLIIVMIFYIKDIFDWTINFIVLSTASIIFLICFIICQIVKMALTSNNVSIGNQIGSFFIYLIILIACFCSMSASMFFDTLTSKILRFPGFFLLILIVCVISILSSLDTSTGDINFQNSSYNSTGLGRYEVCSAKWGRFNITDGVLLSQIAYLNQQNQLDALTKWFNISSSPTQIISQGITAYSIYFPETSIYNSTIVITIRGSSTPQDWLQNGYIWADSVLLRFFSFISPFYLSHLGVAKLIASLKWLRYGLFGDFSYLKELNQFVSSTLNKYNQSDKLIVGHSLGGGLAMLTGVINRVPTIAVSGVGIGYQTGTEDFTLGLASKYLTNIAPLTDLVPQIDYQIGNIQDIDCTGGTGTCHPIYNTFKILAEECNDPRRYSMRDKGTKTIVMIVVKIIFLIVFISVVYLLL